MKKKSNREQYSLGKILPDRLRRPIANQFYRALALYYRTRTRIFHYFWLKILAYRRYLLQPKHFWQFCKIHILMLAIAASEKKFSQNFQHLPNRFHTQKTSSYNQKPKLLFVISALYPGGAERQAVLTMTNFKKCGLFEVALLVFFNQTDKQRFFLKDVEQENIPVEVLNRDFPKNEEDIEALFKHTQLLPQLLQEDTRACIRTIHRQCPDVIHIWLDETNIKTGIAAVLLGVPQIILASRSLPPIYFGHFQPYMRAGYRWLLRQSNVFMINNSHSGARAYEKWLGLPEGKIGVIYNGFDFENLHREKILSGRIAYRKRLKIPSNAPLIGTVMRFSEEKRPLLWIDAAKHIQKKIPNAHFLMLGDGPLRKQAEKKIAKTNLSQRLFLLGNQNDVMTAIASMDLFLLTSRVEGLPNVLIEAQALGIPVVTTDAGGAIETIEPGTTGWVPTSDRPSDIAEQIIFLLQNQNQRQIASISAQEFVKRKFGLERMIRETEAAYTAMF